MASKYTRSAKIKIALRARSARSGLPPWDMRRCARCARAWPFARPEVFEFCVAGGHAKFENFRPSDTSKSNNRQGLMVPTLANHDSVPGTSFLLLHF